MNTAGPHSGGVVELRGLGDRQPYLLGTQRRGFGHAAAGETGHLRRTEWLPCTYHFGAGSKTVHGRGYAAVIGGIERWHGTWRRLRVTDWGHDA